MAVFKKSAVAAFLLGFAFFANPASAVVINVEPDDFGAGTPITNSYPGVTLSVEGSADTVISADGTINTPIEGIVNRATTGTRVFGKDPAFPTAGIPQAWNEGIGFLRADFAAPANFVSIDFIFTDDDYGILKAFNSSDALVALVVIYSDVPGWQTASISRAIADIAYVVAGSPTEFGGVPTGDAILLDNLVANVIPIPAALPLFASGLLVFGFVAARRRMA